MNVIKNCLITNSDAKVLKEYCIDKNSELYRKYKSYNTSVNLVAKQVYNMYTGYVAVLSGNSKVGYEVVVRTNQNQAIRYSNLKSVNVKQRQNVDISQQIGEAKGYVAVEYLSTLTNNQYPFRVSEVQMYKDDPMKILDEENSYMKNTSPQYSQSGLMDFVDEYDGGDNSYIPEFDDLQNW